MTALDRYQAGRLTLLADGAVPGGVTFAFTERTGGVSEGRFASLNLGDACGDEPSCVAENRRLALAAIGAEAWADSLVAPHQVHGDHVVRVTSAEPEELLARRREAREGADAVVCTVPHVPVLLCFADCVPVVVCAPGGFAVAHSGWRGTITRIAAKAVRALMDEKGCAAEELRAYVGPHICAGDYEVSSELMERFVGEFGPAVDAGERHLDLGLAVRAALVETGVPEGSIASCDDSTASNVGRFFSYRAEEGRCGRHAALAVLGSDAREAWRPAPLG
ncbi:polyphenol oxidase family protein [Paratractidigestivibacter faecalis]|uniref:polyphenol oxidase family protein n=1 Tax=Paratractidigestivibacter faecalis TaxID=2292441 RepID=UPI000E3D0485|nr:polyphenol oxidase family protein [Paratractidigestivibacter faecalis]